MRSLADDGVFPTHKEPTVHTIALLILAGSIVFLGVCIYACAGVINELREVLLADMAADDEEGY